MTSRSWIGVIAWLGLFGVAGLVDQVWPQTPLGGVLGFALVFLGLGAVVILGGLGAARAAPSWRLVGWVSLASLLALVGARQLPDALAALGMGAALLAIGAWLGARLGAEVKDPAHLWPLVVVALGADVWSVTSPEGVTRQVVEHGPAVVSWLILTLPVPGVGLSPVLGVGDVLFTGLLMGAVVGLGLPWRRAALGLGIGFLACLVALIALQLPLPALPFLALAAVGALGGAARPRSKELLMAVAFVAAVLLARLLLV